MTNGELNHEFMNLTHNVDGETMKKKKLIVLLLFSTMLLTSCGQKNTSEETKDTEFREEAVTESITEDAATQEEAVTEPEDTGRTEYWLEEQSNVSVYLDQVQDNYVIVDGEREIPFQLDGHPLTPLEIVGAYKMECGRRPEGRVRGYLLRWEGHRDISDGTCRYRRRKGTTGILSVL